MLAFRADGIEQIRRIGASDASDVQVGVVPDASYREAMTDHGARLGSGFSRSGPGDPCARDGAAIEQPKANSAGPKG